MPKFSSRTVAFALAAAFSVAAAACDSPSGVGSGPRPESDPSHPGALSTSGPVLTPASQLSAAQQAGPWAGHAQRLSTDAAAPYVVPQFYYILWQNKSTGDRVLWPMNGTQRAGDAIMLPREDPVWDMAAIADFTGDGDPEILFQNRATGNRGMWSLKGTAWDRWIQLYGEKPEWDFATAADFTGDGQPDIVLQNTTTGQRGFWWMDHAAYRDWIGATGEQPTWRMVAAADFTGDGQNDIVFQNEQTGQRGIWVMNGSTYAGWRDFYVEQPVWDIAAAHDADGDGKPDLLFQNRQTGLRGWALMDGTQYRTWVTLGTVAPEWDIVGTFIPGTGSAAPAVTTDSAHATREPYKTGTYLEYLDLFGTVNPNGATSFNAFFDWSTDSTFAQPQRVAATLTQTAAGVYVARGRLSNNDWNGLKVYYRVGATNPRGTSYAPVKLYEYPRPAAPSNPTAAVEPKYQVRVKWFASFWRTSVFRVDSADQATYLGDVTGSGPQEYVDSTFRVDQAGRYRYRLSACDDFRVCSPPVYTGEVTTPVLPPPSNVQLTISGQGLVQYTVSWADAGSPGYAAFLSRYVGDSFVSMSGYTSYYPAGTTQAVSTSQNTSTTPQTARAYVVSVASWNRFSAPSTLVYAAVPAAP